MLHELREMLANVLTNLDNCSPDDDEWYCQLIDERDGYLRQICEIEEMQS
jgi:hypothetical protein